MRYLKWILAGIAGIVAYKVFKKVQAKRKTVAESGKADISNARQPGMIADILEGVKGTFNFGPNPSVPAIAGSYGFVGVQPPEGQDAYIATNADTRIPTFLDGVTGGVQDPAMPGQTPPPVLGPPPPSGSGAYYAPRYGGNRSMRAAGYIGPVGLTNLDTAKPQKTGPRPSASGTGQTVLRN